MPSFKQGSIFLVFGMIEPWSPGQNIEHVTLK